MSTASIMWRETAIKVQLYQIIIHNGDELVKNELIWYKNKEIFPQSTIYRYSEIARV